MFIKTKQHEVDDFNEELSNSWLKIPNTTSHAESYIFAIQEQEIKTRALQKSREYKHDNTYDTRCRHCHLAKEDIFHLLASCGSLSTSLYLPVRHDEVGKILFNELVKEDDPESPYIIPKNEIWKSDKSEIWWDTSIETTPKTRHNKPDIILWRKEEKECKIIDICIPLEENVKSNEKLKKDRYVQLSIGLKRLYPVYTFSMIPIVLGLTGLITNSLQTYLSELFNQNKVKSIIPKLQQKALLGSMRVIKSAMTLRK